MRNNGPIRICALLLSIALLCLAGCSGSTTATAAPEQTPEPTLELALERIVIFESNSADVADVNGTCSVKAFADAKFENAPVGNAKLGFADGTSTVVDGDTALSLTISKNSDTFLSGDGLSEEASAKSVLYIAFEREAILFADREIEVGALLESLSMATDIPYTFTAVDGFSWASLDGADAAASVIRPDEGVSVRVPSIPKEGSVRGCIYFVPGHTVGAASGLVK